MGLDMFAFTIPEKLARDVIAHESDWAPIRDTERADFFYWRKHPNLHGWMEQLYRDRGGTDEFNCIGIRLYPENLDALEADINDGKLPETSGFFFGQSDGSASEAMKDLRFIEMAREHIAEGKAVIYSSWW